MTDTITVPAIPAVLLPTLDKTRHFGIVAGHFEEGDPMHGALYSQDGFLFDVDGELIEKALSPADRDRMEKVMERNAALAAAKAAFLHVAPNTDPALIDKMITSDALTKPTTEGAIDLVAWAEGRASYRYISVTQEIRKRFNQAPANKSQALEILAEHGLIAPRGGTPTIPSQS